MLQELEFSGYVSRMSYFGTVLSELLQRKHMKAVRLSELSGVGRAMISRYISGDQQWVDPEDLDKLSRAISNDPAEQAELIVARLMDECRGAGSELVEITIRGGHGALKEHSPAYAIKLPKEADAAFGILREWYAKDQNVRETILGLANLLKSGDCRIE